MSTAKKKHIRCWSNNSGAEKKDVKSWSNSLKSREQTCEELEQQLRSRDEAYQEETSKLEQRLKSEKEELTKEKLECWQMETTVEILQRLIDNYMNTIDNTEVERDAVAERYEQLTRNPLSSYAYACPVFRTNFGQAIHFIQFFERPH